MRNGPTVAIIQWQGKFERPAAGLRRDNQRALADLISTEAGTLQVQTSVDIHQVAMACINGVAMLDRRDPHRADYQFWQSNRRALTVPVLGYIGRLGRRPETEHADLVRGC